jgi:cyclopropane-fatty-acyl-phospholipid synthase
MVETLNKGSAGRLVVDSVLNIGPHYARTLREWKHRFLANWESIVTKALVEQYNLDRLEIFRRKWICADSPPSSIQCKQIPCAQTICGIVELAVVTTNAPFSDYCEAGFKTRTLGDHIITFTREGNVVFGCGDDY